LPAASPTRTLAIATQLATRSPAMHPRRSLGGDIGGGARRDLPARVARLCCTAWNLAIAGQTGRGRATTAPMVEDVFERPAICLCPHRGAEPGQRHRVETGGGAGRHRDRAVERDIVLRLPRG